MTDWPVNAGSLPVLGGVAERVLRRAVAGLDEGSLTIRLPSGHRFSIGHKNPSATLHLHSWNSAWRLLLGGDMGFAESYMAGEWSSPDLAALLNIICRSRKLRAATRPAGPVRWLRRLRHLLNRNTRTGSRRNIAIHYDLGNAFYAEWLDRTLSYSSALYSRPGQSLEQAQQEKVSRILELLDMSGDERVLEIGFGWGGLCERILEDSSCRFTGLTLSIEQLAYTRKRLQRFESRGKCELRLQDYRDVRGTFDRIVSVEMLEAVGEAYWPVYFSALKDRLSPDGIVVLQAITIGEDRFQNYRRSADFIQRYIFPGGMLPTPKIMRQQIERAGLRLVSEEYFGGSYARTLADWRRSFNERWPAIRRLGFDDRFRRMWDYYLAYCQAGFEAGTLNVGLYKIAGTRGDGVRNERPEKSLARTDISDDSP